MSVDGSPAPGNGAGSESSNVVVGAALPAKGSKPARRTAATQRSRPRRQTPPVPAPPVEPVAANNGDVLPAIVTGPSISERYLEFLRRFQHDRTLPPQPMYRPDLDITTLSLDELSASE
jgi:hypothetical protein